MFSHLFSFQKILLTDLIDEYSKKQKKDFLVDFCLSKNQTKSE